MINNFENGLTYEANVMSTRITAENDAFNS